MELDAKQYNRNVVVHARAQMVQNNMHSCTKTCTKYAVASENAKKAANRPQASVCRFLFYMIVVIKVLVDGVEKCKSILRRGKRLVPQCCVAQTNERNEYGRAVVKRHHPFISSTSDVGQQTLQNNVDLQFLDPSPKSKHCRS